MIIVKRTQRDPAGNVIAEHHFAPSSVLRPPSSVSLPLTTKAAHLRAALTTWARSGFKKAPRVLRRARLAICATCQHWNPSGNLGLGECRHPACGCTKLKAALLTATCPAQKWPKPLE